MVAAIKKSPQLLTPQKDVLIHLLSSLGEENTNGEAEEKFESRIDAYQDFVAKVGDILDYDNLSCKLVNLDGVTVVSEVFRRVLGINYDHLTPFERREIEQCLDEFAIDHEVSDLPIRDALGDLEERLTEIDKIADTSKPV